MDKACLLVEAMLEPADRQRAENALAHSTSYKDAVKVLKAHYEDHRLLFRLHYDEFYQQDTIKDTMEDLLRVENHARACIRGMEAANSFTAPQLLTAHLEKQLAPGLLRQWRQFTHEQSDLPGMEHFLAFINRQKKTAPDERLSHVHRNDKPNKAKSSATTKNIALPVQDSTKSSDRFKVKCSYCGSNHGIFLCTDFEALAVDNRLEKV